MFFVHPGVTNLWIIVTNISLKRKIADGKIFSQIKTGDFEKNPTPNLIFAYTFLRMKKFIYPKYTFH